MVKNHIAAAFILLGVSSASAQSTFNSEEAALYEKIVGGVETVEDFQNTCDPQNMIAAVNGNMKLLERVGQWCKNTQDARKDDAFDQAMSELRVLPNYSVACDESSNVRLSEERARELSSLEEYKHIKLFMFWKQVYKHVYMCTDKIAKAQKLRAGMVIPGELTRVK